jgi:hypothetical protein
MPPFHRRDAETGRKRREGVEDDQAKRLPRIRAQRKQKRSIRASRRRPLKSARSDAGREEAR